MEREPKEVYYSKIALEVSKRSTCLRRRYGAVIVKNDQIISTGYNGAPRGRKNCSDLGKCEREMKHIPRGERYELCRSVHAEANAIISACRESMIGSILYLSGTDGETGEMTKNVECCPMCKRMIINAGISGVVYYTRSNDSDELIIIFNNVNEWIEQDNSLSCKM